MNRTLVAVRLQLVAWPKSTIFAWAILSIAFAANLFLWASIGLDEVDGAFTGGLSSLYIVYFLAYIASMTQVFPLAVGFGLSRRTFYLSASVVAVAQALAYGIVLALLATVERVSGGWWVGLEFFRPEPLDAGNFALQVAVYAVPFLVLAYIGLCMGVVHNLWGGGGVLATLTGCFALLALAMVAVSLGGGWDEIGRWLQRQTAGSLAAGWPLLLAAVLAAAGYGGIRRAVP
jgi:hypothetical protein